MSSIFDIKYMFDLFAVDAPAPRTFLTSALPKTSEKPGSRRKSLSGCLLNIIGCQCSKGTIYILYMYISHTHIVSESWSQRTSVVVKVKNH